MAREPFAAKLTSIWIGGFFVWMINGFKGELSDQLNDKNENRNMLTGYIIQATALVGIFYWVYFK